MAHIRKGILGGFSGKVGTVIGSSWKQTMYMRSLPKSVKNPRTLAQRTQRAKFALAVALVRPVTERSDALSLSKRVRPYIFLCPVIPAQAGIP